MAPKVEIWSNITPNDGWKFTVDNAQPYVSLETQGSSLLYAPTGLSCLVKGESCNILSYGLQIPSFYQLDSNTGAGLYSTIVLTNTGGALFSLNLPIIWGNYEIAYDYFVQGDTTGAPTQNFTAEFYLGQLPRISMQNVPNSENGKVYPVRFFVKVARTFPQGT